VSEEQAEDGEELPEQGGTLNTEAEVNHTAPRGCDHTPLPHTQPLGLYRSKRVERSDRRRHFPRRTEATGAGAAPESSWKYILHALGKQIVGESPGTGRPATDTSTETLPLRSETEATKAPEYKITRRLSTNNVLHKSVERTAGYHGLVIKMWSAWAGQ
jgi:hypothetical protein